MARFGTLELIISRKETIMKYLKSMLVLILAAFLFVGCEEKDTPAEEAAETVEEATDEVEEAADDNAAEPLEEAADDIEEAAD